MSWLDHARELRDRLLRACIAVFVGLLVGFFVVTWNDYAVITGLINHFAPNGVQTVKPAEPFTETLKLALGKKVTLQNTADGSRYELELLSIQGFPLPKRKG